MNAQTLNQIRQMAEEVAAREGCYLYDIEFVGGGRSRTLRVFIDKDVEGGVSIDDCTNVSRGLNLLLDVEDLVPGGAYNLEVSSPGLERVLREPRHYEKALGKKISVRAFAPLAQFNEGLAQALGKTKQVEGILKAFDEKSLRLEIELEDSAAEIFVPLESVTKAHMVFEFSEPSEKKKSHQKKGKAKS